MNNPRVTKKQIDLMAHTLGGRKPKKWYRNHFCAGTGHQDMADLEELEKLGLMKRRPTPTFCREDDIFFFVTDEGKKFFHD